jgi:hypothetical protein
MTADETLILKTMLALAANVTKISPEKLEDYINVISFITDKDKADDDVSDNEVSDIDVLMRALALLRAYRDESLEHLAVVEKHPFLRKVTPAIGVMEDCLEYYTNKEE